MKLANSVVVITGASSGIGRATALRLARKGARLVLVARPGDALAELSVECERAGAPHAIAAPADITDAGVRTRVVAQTIDAFGRIDRWIDAVERVRPRRWKRLLAVVLGVGVLGFGLWRLRAA